MDDDPKPGSTDGVAPPLDDPPPALPAVRNLPRRASLRPEIRAALALEEAGELQEAARVFEYSGEHAQAAMLRIEYARTVADDEERLDGLREGCARNPGDTAEGQALHRALAEALVERAAATDEPAQRRALQLEAARAFEEADQGGDAGELYETLGLLDRAARAFERAGEINKLELVLEVLERREQREAEHAAHEQEIDRAIASGARRQADVLLQEHLSTRERLGQPPRPGFSRRKALLAGARPRATRVELRWNRGHVTSVYGDDRFVLGRSPDAHLTLAGARLSRHHVELSIDTTHEAGPRLVATDLGSKIGSFWNGDPLEPGEPEPLLDPGELALGMGAPIEVVPVKGPSAETCGALLRASADEAWRLYLPRGGPLVLAPGVVVPARVLFDRGWVVLDFATGVGVDLGRTPLPDGAPIELLVGDRIALHGAPLTLEVLS